MKSVALQQQHQPFDSSELDFTSPVEVVDIPTVVNEPISKEQRLLKREAFVIDSETSQVDETGSQSMKVTATATTTTAATTQQKHHRFAYRRPLLSVVN